MELDILENLKQRDEPLQDLMQRHREFWGEFLLQLQSGDTQELSQGLMLAEIIGNETTKHLIQEATETQTTVGRIVEAIETTMKQLPVDFLAYAPPEFEKPSTLLKEYWAHRDEHFFKPAISHLQSHLRIGNTIVELIPKEEEEAVISFREVCDQMSISEGILRDMHQLLGGRLRRIGLSRKALDN